MVVVPDCIHLCDVASQVYRRLPSLLSEKLILSYRELYWVHYCIRYELSFSLVRLVIMCIHGGCLWLYLPSYMFDAPVDVQTAC